MPFVDLLGDCLSLLASPFEPAELRLATLPVLKDLLFRREVLEKYRPQFIASLRAAADASDLTLRMRVLGMLAREDDPWAMTLLKEGLERPGEARVPPAKAIQLLSYNVKAAEVFPLLQQMVARTSDDAGLESLGDPAPPQAPEVRMQALRMLAADPSSKALLEQVVRDKGDAPEARRIASAGLRSLDAGAMQRAAREIVLDADDHDDIRAASLALLAQGPDEGPDADVSSQAETFRGRSDAMGRSAAIYLARDAARKAIG